ncbi:3'-5'-exoribonuclease [Malassezia sp. CBS 17886]|nr:3'-5'-exoribonuclease [Malassezia sp. CBS 17886]
MPAGQLIAPSLTEEEFVMQSLRTAALRADGRAFSKARPVAIEFGDQPGWCEVSIGDTIIIASVNATLTAPRPERPYEGLLQITTDTSPMAGVEYDVGGVSGAATDPRMREALLDRMVERAVRHTEAVDREALCIIAGKMVWSINLSLHLVSDGGAAFDAAVLASIVALRHYRRPDVTIVDGEVIVHSPDERVPVPLACPHMPLCVTYAVFMLQPQTDEERSRLLAQSRDAMDVVATDKQTDPDVPVALLDPSLLEQTLAHTTVTMVVNAQREVCVLDKAGGIALPYQTILALLGDAAARASELARLVDRTLADDLKKRVESVL